MRSRRYRNAATRTSDRRMRFVRNCGRCLRRVVMKHDVPPMGRRGLVTLAVAFGALSLDVARAQTPGGNSPTAPVARLDDALLASMKAGGRMSFDERYRTLAPVL